MGFLFSKCLKRKQKENKKQIQAHLKRKTNQKQGQEQLGKKVGGKLKIEQKVCEIIVQTGLKVEESLERIQTWGLELVEEKNHQIAEFTSQQKQSLSQQVDKNNLSPLIQPQQPPPKLKQNPSNQPNQNEQQQIQQHSTDNILPNNIPETVINKRQLNPKAIPMTTSKKNNNNVMMNPQLHENKLNANLFSQSLVLKWEVNPKKPYSDLKANCGWNQDSNPQKTQFIDQSTIKISISQQNRLKKQEIDQTLSRDQ